MPMLLLLGGGRAATSILTLPDALIEFWDGDSGLSDSVGPLFEGMALAGDRMPYARMVQVSSIGEHTITDDYLERAVFQFSVFTEGAEKTAAPAARVLAAEVYATLPKYLPVIDDGTVKYAIPLTYPRPFYDPGQPPGGKGQVFHVAFDIEYLVARTMAV